MAIDYEIARARMVQEQLVKRGVTDPRVLKAMGIVPRHYFVDQAFWPRAYGDHPLPIGHGQTISQPSIVGLMTQELNVGEGDKVLEVGTGSGYQAAVLAVLGCSVFTIERIADLSDTAKKILTKLDIKNVQFKVGDGSLGWPDHSPFKGIIVTAGAPDIPDSLVEQLAVGGCVIIPVGTLKSQRLVKIVKGKRIMDRLDIRACSFVPLVGDKAWAEGTD